MREQWAVFYGRYGMRTNKKVVIERARVFTSLSSSKMSPDDEKFNFFDFQFFFFLIFVLLKFIHESLKNSLGCQWRPIMTNCGARFTYFIRSHYTEIDFFVTFSIITSNNLSWDYFFSGMRVSLFTTPKANNIKFKSLLNTEIKLHAIIFLSPAVIFSYREKSKAKRWRNLKM